MAVFAGILSRAAKPPDPAAIGQMRAALARSGDEPCVFQDERIALLRIEPSGTGVPALLETEAGVTAAAGRLLWGEGADAEEWSALAAELAEARWHGLGRARGQFAVAHWAPRAGRLVLATDFCGVRPVYVHATDEAIVFATALHVIEAVDSLALRMDLLGVSEQLSFGYPLGDRTPYHEVRRLRSGEAWLCDARGLQRTVPARMDRVEESDRPVARLADEAHERFLEAIRLRTGTEPEAVAFLSGGLDSRCVAAGLVETGRRVQCVNILRPGRLDTTLARRFAAAMELPLLEQSVPEDERQYVSKGLAFGRLRDEGRLAGRPAAIFTGDGGSVGTGHDYLEDEHVRRMRAGDPAGAARFALSIRGRPSRVAFREAVHRRLTRAIERSIEAELRALDGPAEAGRKFHLFLVQNDQRRHLDHHYEHLDRYRTEFATPFFDAEYLRCVLSVPLDECMRHKFYYAWLERFPAPVREVPWQAYPGHLPCPVPLDPEDRSALTQWQPSRREVRLRVRDDFHACARHVLGGGLPAACGIGRGRAAAVLLLHAVGLRNGMGLFRAVNEYHRHLQRTGGRIEPLPEGERAGR